MINNVKKEIDEELLQYMIDNGYISKRKHPYHNLWIYNYTAKTQYERNWNEISLQTRGLVLDEELNVIARPFSKFFNIEELETSQIPNLPFEVFEKMDGSLFILFLYKDMPIVATRGSFNSEQAIHGNMLLYTKYKYVINNLKPDTTYLFELIYPENKIVVDYGDINDLFLLTIIDNKTGNESIEDIGFPIVKRYDGLKDLNRLKSLEEENKEGFVIKFSNNYRIKVKFEKYFKLHKLLCGISNITIWEYLKDNKSLDELLENFPDETFCWIKKLQSEFMNKRMQIEKDCISVYKEFSTRKETAEYFNELSYPNVLFAMLDNRPIDQIIWKLIKPKRYESMTTFNNL